MHKERERVKLFWKSAPCFYVDEQMFDDIDDVGP